MFNWFKKLGRNKVLEPKYQIRHRVRTNGWIICECTTCDKCNGMCRWEDRVCIPCWHKRHTSTVINEEEE